MTEQGILFDDMHDVTLRRGCAHCKLRGHVIVRGAGPLDSKILVLGERPGHNEVDERRVFVGGSGNLLFQRLRNVLNLERHDVRVENAVRCMPPPKKKVEQDMRWACSMYYEGIINKMPNLKVILALGGIAFNTLLHQYGKDQYSIHDARGHRWVWQDRVIVIPTFHPAYLLRPGNRELIGDFSIDLKSIKAALAATLPDPGEVLFIKSRTLGEKVLRRILERETHIAVDVETWRNKVLTLAISIDDGDNAVVFGHELLDDPVIKRLLLKAIKGKVLIGQNFNSFDRDFVAGLLGECPPCEYDTMFGSYIEDEKRGVHDLNFIAAKYGYFGGYDWELMLYLKRHNLTKANMNKVPLDLLARYNGRDVIANHRAFKVQQRKFSPQFRRLTTFLTKCSVVTNEYENNGVGFDMEESRKLEAMFKERAEKHARLARLAVNKPKLMLTSDHQVRALLYDELQLHIAAGWHNLSHREQKQFQTDTGRWSVNENTLMHLEAATGHKFMKHLLDFRSAQNAIDDHIVSMRKLVGEDGRIHVGTLLHGTRTGRVAMRLHSLKHVFECRCAKKCEKCKHPQDVMWNMFRAREGYSFLKADYSQLEMRIMAEISGDPELIGLYTRGEDFHNATQQIVYADLYNGKGDDKQRRVAKNVNFGTAYGLDEDGLFAFLKGKIRDFSLTPQEVAKFHRDFYARFSTLRDWQLAIIDFMQKKGYVVTWTGRTRALNPKQGKHAENQSVNTIIQSSAHDILLVSALEYFHHRNRRGFMIMEHHDAIISEVPNRHLGSEANLLEKIMCNPPTAQYFGEKCVLKIPLKVDVKVGPTLGNMGELPF